MSPSSPGINWDATLEVKEEVRWKKFFLEVKFYLFYYTTA